MIGLNLDGYDPDSGHEAALAFHIRVVEDEQFIPRHQHRKGQLILALHGALTCEVESGMWMVPPQYAVWVRASSPIATARRRGRGSAFYLSSRERRRCRSAAAR